MRYKILFTGVDGHIPILYSIYNTNKQFNIELWFDGVLPTNKLITMLKLNPKIGRRIRYVV